MDVVQTRKATMKITVTRDHIRAATRRDSHHCMIADAIRDRLKTTFILVDLQSIRWSDLKKGKRYTYLTPARAQRAIIRFDRGEAVEPFAFTLAEPVRVRKVQRRWTGDPKVIAKARAKYEKYARKRSRKSARPNVASRERHFGVRALVA
jgi:hypothetical protein